jgi:hypothetical protein
MVSRIWGSICPVASIGERNNFVPRSKRNFKELMSDSGQTGFGGDFEITPSGVPLFEADGHGE